MIHCIKVLFLCQIWNRRLIQCVDLLFRFFMPGKASYRKAFETQMIHLNVRKHKI